MSKYNISKRERELIEKIHTQLQEMGRHPGAINWDHHRLFMALCPFHDDHNPSFNVYVSDVGVRYKCFGCGASGSIYKLAKQLNLKLPQGRSYQKREKLTPDVIPTIVEKAHKLMMSVYENLDELHPELFIVERGFVKESDPPEKAKRIVQKYKLGFIDGNMAEEIPQARPFLGRLIIPYFDENGNTVWFNARRVLDEEYHEAFDLPTSKYYNPGGKTRIYNAQHKDFAIEQGYVFIVEGELDAISFMEATGESIPVMAVPGAGLSGSRVRDFIQELAKHKVKIFILTDPDTAGKELAIKLKKIVQDAGGWAKIVRLYTLDGRVYKGDVNDALRELGKETLRKMIEHELERQTSPGDSWYIKNFPFILKKRQNRVVYPTGISAIDEVLGGGYYEGLHIIGGITSAGKTSFALKIATHNALHERPVLFFTYEMSKFELWTRIITSIVSSVNYLGLKTGNHPEKLTQLPEWDKIEKISRYLKIFEGDAGMIDENAELYSVEEIALEAEHTSLMYGVPPLVIVDYIQRMPATGELKRKDVRERVDFIVTGLQTRVARELGCPVIALSSISRAGYEINESTPFHKKIQVFKESGGIEFTGYTVALLWYQNGTPYEELTVYFDILKNRENGLLKTIPLRFDPHHNHWEAIQ